MLETINGRHGYSLQRLVRAAGGWFTAVHRPRSCVWLCVDGEQPSCFHASLPMCKQHLVPLPIPSLVGTGC